MNSAESTRSLEAGNPKPKAEFIKQKSFEKADKILGEALRSKDKKNLAKDVRALGLECKTVQDLINLASRGNQVAHDLLEVFDDASVASVGVETIFNAIQPAIAVEAAKAGPASVMEWLQVKLDTGSSSN